MNDRRSNAATRRNFGVPAAAAPAASLVLLLLLCASAACLAAEIPTPKQVTTSGGMVVSVSPPASEAGAAALRKGGNAVDAAVATALALAVTFPEAGNIGGGGFMLIRPATGEPTCIEYRETAPAACDANTFSRDKAQTGHRVVGVPGTLRGLELAHRKFGRLAWRDLVLPAVELARDGFAIDRELAGDLNALVQTRGKRFPEFVRVFGKPGGTWQPGDILRQPDLADTLQRIADRGPDDFYTGKTAELLLAEMRRGSGLLTADDLRAYRAVERRPVHGTFRGYDLYSSPPPSSGGTLLVEMLNILETFPLKQYGRYSPETLHLTTEAMRRAYADRARYLGDPAFTEIPAKLTTQSYAAELARGIDPRHATPSAEVAPEIPLADEGSSTTHFSVVDRDRMAVANTYTLQNSYGSMVVVRGAGFLLNNEMTDFNWRPGVTDRKGRIGTPPNQIAPGKRMLSSQSPTIVCRDGRLVLVTGSPGGRTIPNTVLGVLLNVLEFEMNLDAAIAAPRTHHQWFPDVLQFEGIGDPRYADALAKLKQMGHRLADKPHRQGDAHSILVRDGRLQGVADRRVGEGKAAVE